MTVTIRASKTEYLTVEVEKRALLEKTIDLVKAATRPTDIPQGAYINREGRWETWEDGHGSGYTETFRAALPEENRRQNVISDFEKICRDVLSRD